MNEDKRIENFAYYIHGELEISKGGPMSEEQVVRLVHRLSKITETNPVRSQVPDYVRNSAMWEKIRNFFPNTIGRME